MLSEQLNGEKNRNVNKNIKKKDLITNTSYFEKVYLLRFMCVLEKFHEQDKINILNKIQQNNIFYHLINHHLHHHNL